MGTIDFPTSPTTGQTYSMGGKIWGYDGTKWDSETISNPWVRPSNWLTLPDVTGLQKFAGLHAVFPDSNFVALSAEGNYTVNWGDGTGDTNVSSGVTAEYNIPYANAAATSDVGISAAIACSFSTGTDKVNLTAHGWNNGQQVAFNTITSTSGISTYTTYYIVNKTANDFQISTTINGATVTLTTNGSGTVYVPKYRQVIVTVVPNGGNLTKLNLHIKHSTTDLQTYSSGFLDIAISAQYMTDLRLGVQTPHVTTVVIYNNMLEQFNLVASDLRQCSLLFNTCRSLANIVNLVTSSAAVVTGTCTFTDAGDVIGLTGHGFRNGDSVVFTSVTTTGGISINTIYYIINTTTDTFQISTTYGGSAVGLTGDGTGVVVGGTNFNNMFNFCYNLRDLPLFDTSKCINFTSMFSSCYSLKNIPLLNTSKGLYFAAMFNGCATLKTIPLLDTSSGVYFNSMFASCSNLKTIPLLNTSSGTNFSTMFSSCPNLESIPLLNTSLGTNFSSMFQSCYSLRTIPLLNTGAGTSFSSMFNACVNFESMPLLNTGAGTNFSSMFSSCYKIKTIPQLNTLNGQNFNTMFNTCYSLVYLPPLITSSATSITTMFTNCFSLKSAAFQGTGLTYSIASCNLSAAELNKIYTGLATVTSKTITVTGNWGVAADDPTIATAKGWTVTG